jgi:hypothetical protein
MTQVTEIGRCCTEIQSPLRDLLSDVLASPIFLSGCRGNSVAVQLTALQTRTAPKTVWAYPVLIR